MKVETFLAPEIEQGLVEVIDRGNVLTVRVAGNGLFGSGSDVLEPDFVPVIDRIAAALNDEPGRIIVAGHSDNIPINTARFPSTCSCRSRGRPRSWTRYPSRLTTRAASMPKAALMPNPSPRMTPPKGAPKTAVAKSSS